MIELRDVHKAYTTGSFTQKALDGVSLTFRASEFVAILGPSGSGKTTLLNVIGGLDRMDQGDLIIDGTSTAHYSAADWDSYRNHRIGFVFQSYNLIPHQTVLSNVELALTLAGISRSERRQRARNALDKVGLSEHINKRPGQLSGGQAQRVAIARALVNDPDIILADEPTGALDTDTGLQIMDLLQEVSRERLVIMVTHNPELADSYATRTVRIQNGHVQSDTDPVQSDAHSYEGDKAQCSALPTRKHRASMSFPTALRLSFSNLMTKKGRTIMTSFAGSIGIIGIAAILALANGVNNYIAKVESDMLSSYPLSITSSNTNLASFVSATMTQEETDEDSPSDILSATQIVQDMFASIESNDLSSFRDWIESDSSDIKDYVSAIDYDYGIAPQIYASDTSESVVRLSPSSTTGSSTSSTGSSLSVSIGISGFSTSGSFQEMIGSEDILQSQYDLVAGRWASSYDECVLVLNSSGSITDYTLYSIGVYDPQILSDALEALATGQSYSVPQEDDAVTYDDILEMSFIVLPSAATYAQSSDGTSWVDKSSDTDYMRTVLEQDGVELKVVGIIQPNDETGMSMLSEGIAYTQELTSYIMEQTASYQIVQDQLANPDVDVFTGETFDSLQEGATGEYDLSSLFSIDASALEDAFSFDGSGLAGIDLSSLDISGSNALDSTSLADALDVSDLMSAVLTSLAADMENFPDYVEEAGFELTDEQSTAITQVATQLFSDTMNGYIAFMANNPGMSAADALDAYLASDEAQQLMQSATNQLATALQDTNVATNLMDYFTSYLTEQLASYAPLVSDQIATQLELALTQAMQSLVSQLSSSLSSQLASQLAQNLTSAFTIDEEALSAAIQVNITSDDLLELLTTYANANSLSYDSNLATLGYASEDMLEAIRLYPIDLKSKELILESIDAYNEQMLSEGREEQVISYTDSVGALLGSVTDIIDTISLVLIAFVSISLVVSSIMIGIITYISVIERKKEIGILRAMGASKRNIASIFNAEAAIEGLAAGIFAVALVALISVPINTAVRASMGISQVMALPVASTAVLVGLSVILTLFSSLIPSQAAARKDPVEALRTE